MCLHSVVDRTLSNGYEKYTNVSLDEFDNCDYVTRITDATSNDLVVIQLNIRGLSTKRTQLMNLINNAVHDRKPDLILLSETWLTPFSPAFSIPGYELYHLDRTNRKGGGVGILSSSKLRSTIRNDLNSNLPESECITIEIALKNGTHCLVSSMYRPPNSEVPVFLASYSSLVCAMKKECPNGTIVGLDHNLDFLKAHSHQLTNDFIQLNLDLGMIPTITRPTRITNSTATLIDNIMVSQNNCGNYVASVLIEDISDHLPTSCVINSFIASTKKPMKIYSRDTRQKNMKALVTELDSHDWTHHLTNSSPSINMEEVHTALTSIIDKCIPLRTRFVHPRHLRKEPWLTPGIKISIDKNKRLYTKMLKKEVTETTYRNYNRELRKIIRKAKRSYYCDKCIEFKSQTKKLWGLINEISGKKRDKSTLIEYLHIGDIREYGVKRISNTFASYFSQVGKNLAEKMPNSNTSIGDYLRCLQSHKSSIYLHPTDVHEIKKIVGKLPSKRSSGHDNISNILLKDIVSSIAEVLCEIFNRSLEQGEFPSIMKLADVVPLFKGKEHYLEINYRPISLLTTISKVLEKIVYQRIYSFLQTTGQLYENQYGFREAHSCEHAIGKVINGIVKGLENKKTSACVLLDLSKAFDTIEHGIMLEKLSLYSIRGNALAWFKSYLSDRTLRVKCRTVGSTDIHTSDEYSVKYGTPQGSCLGPLIFLIFVNDLHLHLHEAECVQFADDTTLLFKHKNVRYLQFCIESELKRIQDWLYANKLTLNVSKCSYLLFSANNKHGSISNITLNDIEIPKVRFAKLLGTWIDDKLTWDTHVKKLMVKLRCGIGMLQRSHNLLSVKAKKLLYYGQIHSNLCYCLSIWGTMIRRKLTTDIARLQRKAVKLIDNTITIDKAFQKHRILPFEQLIKLEQCKLGFKLCKNLLPTNLAKCMNEDHNMKSITKTHRYPTRKKHIPNLPHAVVNKYRDSFLYRAIKEYNDLNPLVQSCKSLPSFIGRCKKRLLSNLIS